MVDDPRDQWTAALEVLPDSALEELNRFWTIARAFTNTAHAVNNSLQVIGGRAELLQASAGLPTDLLPGVQAIGGQSAKAAAAINDLLGYCRGAEGQGRTDDVAALMDAAVAMRSHSLGRARILVDVNRPAGEPHRVAVGQRELLQLLLNLLLMAEAALLGREKATITLTLDRDGSRCRIGVVGSAAPDAAPRATPVADFNQALQRRLIVRLAARLDVGLTIEEASDQLPVFGMTLPA